MNSEIKENFVIPELSIIPKCNFYIYCEKLNITINNIKNLYSEFYIIFIEYLINSIRNYCIVYIKVSLFFDKDSEDYIIY